MRMGIVIIALALPAGASAQARLPKGQEEINRAAEKIVRGEYPAAEPLLRQALVDAPSDPWGHFNLASVLRDTGRSGEAVSEYAEAKRLFETAGSGRGNEHNVANCLYGRALAQEAIGDAQASIAAWNDYIGFAVRFGTEQPAVAIAREHIHTDQYLAGLREPSGAAHTATRPSVVR
ncbi:MAG: hypothetical protein JWN44_4483 [Myxococcales bacterium]|nr:hypothetical protein [Myxococcales bacterium]